MSDAPSFCASFELRRRHVDRDDPRSTRDAGALDDVQADTAASDHCDRVGGAHSSDVEHRPEASDDRAADDRGKRRWHRRRHPHERPFVDQHAVAERPDVRHRADRAPVGGEEPRPLAAGPPRRVRVRAHERLTLLATCARAAADDEAGDDVVADGHRLDSGADRFDDADRLVAEQHWPRPGEHSVEVVEVAVAQPGRQCAHCDLARPRRVDVDLGDDEEVGSVIEHCSHGHASDRTPGVTGGSCTRTDTQNSSAPHRRRFDIDSVPTGQWKDREMGGGLRDGSGRQLAGARR